MAQTWTQTTIGDLIAKHGGSIKTGPFGTTLKAAEYSREGVPLISVGEIGYGTITLHESTPRVSPKVTERLSVYLLEEGDIVFGRKGAVDRCAIVQPEQSGWFLGSDGIRLRLPRDGKVCDARFIAYCLQEESHRAWILSHATGTTMPSLNQGVIERIPIPLPPLPTQLAVARILAALDDKIAVCRRTAQVLESMTRALYESWFIRFQHPSSNSDGVTLVDSPLGQIPEGWAVGAIGDLVEAVGGGTPSTKEPAYWNEGTHAFCTPKDMSGLTEPAILGTERRVTDEGLDQISSGLLPPGTVIMSSRAPIGYLAIAEIPLAVNQGIIAMKCKAGISPVWVLRWCDANMARIKAAANGSTFMEISKQHFRPLAAAIPPVGLMSEFATIAEPMHRRLVALVQQANALAALRKVLLPKLISGELAVPDVAVASGRGA